VVNVNPDTVAVTLDNGERIVSDVIIGADGFNSLVRTTVAGEQVPGTREKDVSVNFTIPTDVMKAHEDLRSLTTNSDVRLPRPLVMFSRYNASSVVSMVR